MMDVCAYRPTCNPLISSNALIRPTNSERRTCVFVGARGDKSACNSQNRKYIKCTTGVSGGPNHGHRQHVLEVCTGRAARHSPARPRYYRAGPESVGPCRPVDELTSSRGCSQLSFYRSINFQTEQR